MTAAKAQNRSYGDYRDSKRGYHGFIPRMKEIGHALSDSWNKASLMRVESYALRTGNLSAQTARDAANRTLTRPVAPPTQKIELNLHFDNAPAGLTLQPQTEKRSSLLHITHDVGYSPLQRKR